jgi:DNA-binding MarR family transcriptional regulator
VTNREKFLARLWDLGRVVSTQTVFLHQAIAQRVGLNATDTKCVDLILRGPAEGVTAGWLSAQTGLTTGAITHILDRLEKRGFVERVRDTVDRRRVFVCVNEKRLAPLAPVYEGIGNAYMRLAERYSDKELAVICDYMEQAAQVSERERARIIGRDEGSGQTDSAARPRRGARTSRAPRRR